MPILMNYPVRLRRGSSFSYELRQRRIQMLRELQPTLMMLSDAW